MSFNADITLQHLQVLSSTILRLITPTCPIPWCWDSEQRVQSESGSRC